MEHLTLEQVNDLVDGTPSDQLSVGPSRHLAECALCRQEVEAYRRVHSRLRALLPDYAPPHGMYADIAFALRRRRRLTTFARAAAIGLLAGGTAVTWPIMRRQAEPSLAWVADAPGTGAESTEEALERAFAAATESLPEPSAAAVQRTVASLDKVIAATRNALVEHPQDARLESRYQRAQQLRRRIMGEAVNWSRNAPKGGVS